MRTPRAALPMRRTASAVRATSRASKCDVSTIETTASARSADPRRARHGR
jgi:hypothetical protein